MLTMALSSPSCSQWPCQVHHAHNGLVKSIMLTMAWSSPSCSQWPGQVHHAHNGLAKSIMLTMAWSSPSAHNGLVKSIMLTMAWSSPSRAQWRTCLGMFENDIIEILPKIDPLPLLVIGFSFFVQYK